MAPARAAQVATSALAPLPLPLAPRVFLLLPVNDRARCACVCKAWRDTLADPSLWTHLDLVGLMVAGLDGGCGCLEGSLLHGAARRAQGQLRSLDVSGPQHVLLNDLLNVLRANAHSLRELCLRVEDDDEVLESSEDDADKPTTLEQIVAAAPHLHTLTADAEAAWNHAPRLMHASPPLDVLRLRTLHVTFESWRAHNFAGDVGPFAAALADATLQPTLAELSIEEADLRPSAALDALIDGLLRRPLQTLHFVKCTPLAAETMARLLSDGTFTTFGWKGNGSDPLVDDAGAALVADALRANRTLTSLSFDRARLCDKLSSATAVLGALVGHSSLRSLRLSQEGVECREDAAALGAALAAIVDADAPALEALELSDNGFGAVCLAAPVLCIPYGPAPAFPEARFPSSAARQFVDELVATPAGTWAKRVWAQHRHEVVVKEPTSA